MIAWRNVPKAGFLSRLAQMIYFHNLALQKVVATHIDLSSTETILILSLGLHGLKGLAAWEEADINDFLREVALLKYFETDDKIDSVFVDTHLLSAMRLIWCAISPVLSIWFLFMLIRISIRTTMYWMDFAGHPELTVQLCKTFRAKFDPEKHDLSQHEKMQKELIDLIDMLDTGQAINDLRRKNVLKQALNFIDHTLKTNFYRNNKSAFAFRLDPKYLDNVPFDRKEKFPELPYEIFFIRGNHFIGFNIRFKDLSRGASNCHPRTDGTIFSRTKQYFFRGL